jgi:hypothetical protein
MPAVRCSKAGGRRTLDFPAIANPKTAMLSNPFCPRTRRALRLTSIFNRTPANLDRALPSPFVLPRDWNRLEQTRAPRPGAHLLRER